MVRTTLVYKGEKNCEITHDPSGSKIKTDAPKDNNGKGETFSPTDLIGAALSSCVVTTMAIFGERHGINFIGTSATVDKVMTGAPRRIQSLSLTVRLPASLTPDQRTKMEEIARTCPVHRSLHPDVQMPMTFIYE